MRVCLRQYAAAVGALAFLAVTGCEKPAAVSEISPTEESSAVAATIDGNPIYVSDVLLAAEEEGIIDSGDTLEVDSPEFNRILDQLIDVRLMSLEAQARGLDAEPHARYRLQAVRENTLANILIETIIAERVDEAAIRKMYDAQIAIADPGEETRVRQIVTATKADMDGVVEELNKGADFAVLAAQKSIDESTRLDGGDLGYLDVDTVSPQLAQAMKSTATGGISKPFETSDGWMILKIDDRRPEAPPSLEDLRGDILNYLGMDEINRELKQLRSESDIVRRTSSQAPPLQTDPFSIAPEGKLPAQIEAQGKSESKETAEPGEDVIAPDGKGLEVLDAPGDGADSSANGAN